MKSPPTKANHRQFIDAVSGILNVKTKEDTWDAFASAVDEGIDIDLPFSLSSLRIVYERLPLYSEILHPKKNSMLFDFLDEDVNATYLLMDKMLQGKTAVHVVKVHANASELAEYVGIFKSPTMVANTIPELGVVSAVALKSFRNIL
jgi:hypothetical protein